MESKRIESASYSLMHSLRNTEWTVYAAFELAIMVGKSLRAVQKKAIRQQWPYHLISQPGRHKRIYTIVTLPDDIQIQWASLESEKYYIDDSIPHHTSADTTTIIRPLTRIQAEVALSWPERDNYYTILSTSNTKGPKSRVYDGVSQGLCKEAREILLDRFVELRNISVTPSGSGQLSHELIGNQQLLEKLLEEKDKRIEMLEHYAEENRRLMTEIQEISKERNQLQKDYLELLLIVQEHK